MIHKSSDPRGTSGGSSVPGGALPASLVQPRTAMIGREVIVTYKGTLVRDLQKMVDICLRWNARICANCGQCYGVHSEYGTHCPNPITAGATYLETRFAELRGKERASVTAGDVVYDNSPSR